MQILNYVLAGNSLIRWIIALLITLLVMAALRLVQRLVVQRIRKITDQTKNQVDDLALDMIENTKPLLIFFPALYAGSLTLRLPTVAERILSTVALATLLIQAALWGNQLISFFLKHYVRDRAEDDNTAQTAYTAANFILRVVLWTLILLLILDNIPGVEITSLITGLGITGVAVALAVQNILQDLFASLTIVLDKPFVIGDFIVVDEYSGTVEHIGLKTTRVRSLSGEELVFSNADLLTSRVQNFKKMRERRVVFTIGVTYETPYEKLKLIPQTVREKIEEQKLVRFDRAHLKTFGDFALEYEVVYYMLEPDYNVYMDTQQAINLEIVRRFADEGIEFAYPTQKLYMESLTGPAPAL
jgi:small-conductance mechanosensitive channel